MPRSGPVEERVDEFTLNLIIPAMGLQASPLWFVRSARSNSRVSFERASAYWSMTGTSRLAAA
ncbi:MAG: hypothetical protein OJF47_000252 [Nitrospira sp.]|nr:MAG: hypothetical protein OJF47_000252 [Nitrospira sp.]